MHHGYTNYGINPEPGTPSKSEHIASGITEAIKRSLILPKEKLLSQSKLSKHLKVDPKTVAQAYEILENEGLIEVKHKSGCYVVECPILVPTHYIPLFSKEIQSKSIEYYGYQAADFKGYANFATVGNIGINLSHLLQSKQSPFHKVLSEAFALPQSKWVDMMCNTPGDMAKQAALMMHKRGLFVDAQALTISRGSMRTLTLATRLLVKPA